MPKSEFTDQLPVHGGQVTVSGIVDPDTTARAKKSGADVDVHWVVAQGDVVAHGHVHGDGRRTFTRKDQDGAQPWTAGPAQVSGVTVTVTLSRRPAQMDASSGTRRSSSWSPERSTAAQPQRHRSPTAAAHAAQQLTAPGGLADREVVHMAVKYRRWDADDRVSAQWYTVLSAAKADGVSFLVTDGHRTMAEQQERWNTFQHGGARAAFPSPTAPHIRTGRPDHAIDVNASTAAPGASLRGCARTGRPRRSPSPARRGTSRCRATTSSGWPRSSPTRSRATRRRSASWIRAYDALVRMKDAGHDPADGSERRSRLRRLMTDRRKAIWRAAQHTGWHQLKRRARYRSLLARTANP